jgi:hypothetical protein
MTHGWTPHVDWKQKHRSPDAVFGRTHRVLLEQVLSTNNEQLIRECTRAFLGRQAESNFFLIIRLESQCFGEFVDGGVKAEWDELATHLF